MAHNPAATRHVGALGAYMRFGTDLPPLLREAVTLAVAGRWDSSYERLPHPAPPPRLGLSPPRDPPRPRPRRLAPRPPAARSVTLVGGGLVQAPRAARHEKARRQTQDNYAHQRARDRQRVAATAGEHAHGRRHPDRRRRGDA